MVLSGFFLSTPGAWRVGRGLEGGAKNGMAAGPESVLEWYGNISQ